jgi:hypothetical protein
MAGGFPMQKFAVVMAFYALLACVLMPILFYYLMGKTVCSAGNGFIAGSVVSVLLWVFVGRNFVKGKM